MKIKYLVSTHDANAGDEVEVLDVYSEPLIAMGFAEEVVDKPKPKTTAKKTTAK